MSVTIKLPSALRPFAQNRDSVNVEGRTAGEALQALFSLHAALKGQLTGTDGRIRNFVNVFVNDDDLRELGGLDAPLKNDDVLSIVPAIAGGSEGGSELTPAELRRYGRHLILPEVGSLGQLKLKRARVLCIGAGGLGCPASLYLAAAGVGTLGLVDFDVVDESNLQRQVLYTTKDVGQPKLQAAKKRLTELNPGVSVELFEERLTSQNAIRLFEQFDLILDGTDNFPTRYLVNDACVLTGKPNAYGSVFRFEGQASVFAAQGGPCYRCLYPEPPPPGLVPSCAEGGVLGVLPGVIGTLQAVETIKLILGIGRPLIGRLMLFDALAMEWRTLKIKKNPACAVCGDKPTIRALIDYEAFCAAGAKPPTLPEVSVEQLKAKLDRKEPFMLLDVREPHEYELARIEGARLIPLAALPERLGELDKAREILVHCKMGGRSAKAVALLRDRGFQAVNVAGGINAWSERIDPTVPTY